MRECRFPGSAGGVYSLLVTDFAFVLLTLAVFALLALCAKGAGRL